jgi:CubicO group peptidase (beta-lactamase class C family)
VKNSIFPKDSWDRIPPIESGFDPDKLENARRFIDENAPEGRYRVVIVHKGSIVAEWNKGVGADDKLSLTSATKSVLSCILGIAIDEGRILSLDSKLTDYFPEAMDVPEGKGPKPGRYAFEKDRNITLRQLISNTSGYMKPGEEPGEIFHYQSFGMNVINHAIAKSYGYYDIGDPENSLGITRLIDERIRLPIGARWSYSLHNFDLHEEARTNIFGYGTFINSTVADMARLGWLWIRWGRWENEQLVPEYYLREATQTAPDIRAHSSQESWKYGYGFWTNDCARLLPGLPQDSFAASGSFGTAFIWVCPGLELVLAQNPGLYFDKEDTSLNKMPKLLKLVSDAIE